VRGMIVLHGCNSFDTCRDYNRKFWLSQKLEAVEGPTGGPSN